MMAAAGMRCTRTRTFTRTAYEYSYCKPLRVLACWVILTSGHFHVSIALVKIVKSVNKISNRGVLGVNITLFKKSVEKE